jgi:hypothetical protein
MAIKSNKKIDFEYEYVNGDAVFSIWLRLYESADCGMSIGVLDENGEIAISFPVGMFAEITDFLIAQGVLEGKRTVSASLPVQKTVAQKSSSLPRPRLVSSRPIFKPKNITNGPTIVNLEQDDGDDLSEYPEAVREQIRQEQARLNDIQNAIDGATPAMSLSAAADQTELTEEEARNILQERQIALKKAQDVTKKIKKRDDSE